MLNQSVSILGADDASFFCPVCIGGQKAVRDADGLCSCVPIGVHIPWSIEPWKIALGVGGLAALIGGVVVFSKRRRRRR